ncbi:MAG: glutamine--tRNA ligase/YqeY domain fusion protein [Labilithrix sp.]|nr:glutamine--tRNA ligase/YqeY domain fusion protein [Labilithrix sp.]MCW5817122.1 glutamine--tRNA ligase/YqeY domain fusion protein [Labilithrix sp.]
MEGEAKDFIREMIRADVAAGKHGGKVVTRFPPEPNGWLHIGHAKAICIDFGVAQEFGGRCHLRMDDTNPTTEDMDYVRAIQRDVKWLGFDWGEHMYYASDYFARFYELGRLLIERGRAYVCDLSEEEFSKSYRGTITEPGKVSPFASRSVEENLDLFRRMKEGEFKDGERVLRARIDMASPNMKMRDPPLVRIKHAHHFRTGDAWCIYPLYDYAHCLEDSFEGVTHSLCTLEFESARELYDWVIQATEVPHVPKQTEFARLNITYTVMSKRKLLQLVEQKHVSGWDDPRMPTIAGLRRRGVTPEALRTFCARIGVAKNISTVDIALLEHTIREDLDRRSPRVMAVLNPVELVVDTWAGDTTDELEAGYWPAGTEPAAGAARTGSRTLPFSRVLYVERDDFAEDPPKGWHRLAIGKKVRLRHGYIVTCTSVEKDAAGNVVRIHCAHDPDTRGGTARAGEKVDGTIHWVSASHAVDVDARIYDRLFTVENPGDGDADFVTQLNPRSLTVVKAKAEPSLATARAGEHYQLERVGFFVVDEDTAQGPVALNRTVALKDSWQKVVAAASAPSGRPAAAAPAAGAPRAPKESKVAELSPEAIALRDAHGLAPDIARAIAGEPALASMFLAVVATAEGKAAAKPIATMLANDVLGELRARKLDAVPFGPAAALELAALLKEGIISSAQTKEVLAVLFVTPDKTPRAVVAEKGLAQIANADALLPVVDEVLAANADAVGRYKAGNANVVGALVGMVMKKSGGRANAKLVKELLEQRLA